MTMLDTLRPTRRKRAFVGQLPRGARLLDVGCGNNSPERMKSLRPDVFYVGVDIGDYNQTAGSKGAADQYVLTSPEKFHEAIEQLGTGTFDGVVSAHNLEHCLHPDLVLSAMCKVLKPGGQLHLAFPCEESVDFPSRKGTLNFHDDDTHRTVPSWSRTIAALENEGMHVTFGTRRYRPVALAVVGALFEPFVAPFRRQAPKAATWALYGFESIIWAVKRPL